MPYIGYSIAVLPVVAFVPAFYASERGLSLAAVGLIIALTRITDVVTDPIVGWVSDRLRTPIGRRKPVILLGLPLFCTAIWMLFVPPQGVGLSYVFIWTALLYFGFTLVDLPLKALGAELSPCYDERSELAGWREGLGLVGTLLGLGAAVLVSQQSSGELGPQLYVLSLLAITLTPLLFILSFSLLREPSPHDEAVRELALRTKFRVILRNGPFKLLLLISLLVMSCLFGASTLSALIMEHVYQQKDMFPLLLLVEIVTMVMSIPFWLALSKRLSKHKTLAIAALVAGVTSFAFPVFAHSSLVIFAPLAVLKAFCLGAFSVLLNGIAADVVDIDTARTGEARTGVYFALWGMINKGAVALGVFAATNIPVLLGYQVGDSGVHGQELLLWTYGIAPGIGMLISAKLLGAWPLTRERQARLRVLIDRRAARLAASKLSTTRLAVSAD